MWKCVIVWNKNVVDWYLFKVRVDFFMGVVLVGFDFVENGEVFKVILLVEVFSDLDFGEFMLIVIRFFKLVENLDLRLECWKNFLYMEYYFI